jgi:hypothetical protein
MIGWARSLIELARSGQIDLAGQNAEKLAQAGEIVDAILFLLGGMAFWDSRRTYL